MDQVTIKRQTQVRRHWERAWVYAAAWLPPLAFLVVIIPKFGDVFRRLEERQEMPLVTSWVWALARLNQAWYLLPVFLGLGTLIALGEIVVVYTRPTRIGHRIWAGVVVAVGVFAWLLLVRACVTPVFRNPA